jgi:uncharacterized protein YbjT (DUF2867 family)
MRLVAAVLAALVLAWHAPAPAAEPATGVVLVAGATGRAGRHVVEQLLQRGRSVRVLARSEAGAREIFGERVQVVQGDVREPATLGTAVAGVRYVVWAVGSNSRTDPSNLPEAVDYRGVRNLVEAAVAAGGVEHFVLVSSRGVAEPTHPLNRFASNVLLWKGLGENALRFSGLPYTVVRPGGLTDGPGGKGIRGGPDAALPAGSIARADVARVCVEALGNRAAYRKTIALVGDPAGGAMDWPAFFRAVPEDNQVRIGE